jgi:ketosteroid isomerase-like protein
MSGPVRTVAEAADEEASDMRNVDTVQAIYQAFGTGDVPTIIGYLADDVAWEQWEDNTAQKEGVDHLQPRQGKAGAQQFFELVSSFEIRDFQVLSILDGGDQVAAEIVIEAVLPNGGQYRDEEMHLWSFDEAGKVSRLRHYTDTAKHIAAARGER